MLVDYCHSYEAGREGGGGKPGFLGGMRISIFGKRKLKDTQILKCEDRRLQNCIVLKTEDLAT